MKTTAVKYERLNFPLYFDKNGPKCPECKGHLQYVGLRSQFERFKPHTYKVYQCRDCKSLFLEMPVEERLKA